MSDESNQGWKGLLAGVSSPWDWAAIGAGAGAGAAATILIGGADLGSSIAAGATGGLAARKAIEASFAKRQLRRQLSTMSSNLLILLNARSSRGISRPSLAERLEDEIDLWKQQISSDAEFSDHLQEIKAAYRRNRNSDKEEPDNLLKMPRR